jgi:hypothetical protein
MASSIRRLIAVASITLAFGCGGGADPAPENAVPEGRCETDADCAAGQRCAEVALICDAPPYCGACVAAPR